MMKQICLLLLFPVWLHAQNPHFTVNNDFPAQATYITSAGLHENTRSAELPPSIYCRKALTETNEVRRAPSGVKKFRFQAGMVTGFGASDNGIVRHAGLETKLIFYPGKKADHGISFQTGLEAHNGYLPTLIFPFCMGYQLTVFRKNDHLIHIHGNAGWALADIQENESDWQTQSVQGGARYGIGITWFPGFFKEASFYTGAGLLFQQTSYKIESEWIRSEAKQNIQRIIINFGVLL